MRELLKTDFIKIYNMHEKQTGYKQMASGGQQGKQIICLEWPYHHHHHLYSK